MATTEHTLRLKAVLDSKQVQQELQRLRQMQQQQIQNVNRANQAGAVSRGPQNIGNIGQSLTRLDATINNLSRQLTQLNSTLSRQQMQQRAQHIDTNRFVGPAQLAGNTLLPLILGDRYQLRSATAQRFSQHMATVSEGNLLKSILKYGPAFNAREFANMMGRGPNPWNSRNSIRNNDLLMARLAATQEMIGPTTTFREFKQALATYQQQQTALAKGKDPMQEYIKFSAALMGAQGLQQLGTGLTNMGYKTAGGVMSDLGTLGTSAAAGAATGAAVGSVVPGLGTAAGAGIGTIFGTVTGAIEVLGNQAKEATQNINSLTKSIEQIRDARTKMYGMIDTFVKSTRFEDWQKGLESESEDDLVLRKYRKERELARAKEDRTALATSIPQEKWTQYQKYISEFNKAKESNDEEKVLEVENKYTQEVKKIAERVTKVTQNLEDLQKEYDSIDAELTKRRAKASKIATKDREFFKAMGADTMHEFQRRLLKDGSLADIQAEYTKTKERQEEAIRSHDTEKFQKYTQQMRTYQYAIENIKEVQSQSLLNLQRMDESYENTRVLERYGYGGGRGLHNTLIGYGRKAASERSRYEQLIKEGKLDEAEKAKQSWQFAAGERNQLASQVLQLLGGRTADLTNVTSLASMGFGMGEKNDNYDRQMKVLEDQRDLQRDIKNILNEKTFAATYGE